ncbi:MAG: DNA polymerase/3'-5' exonuclease PolX [Bacteroidetes bacterium]|nr:MAG: DNA polymerase/3'-5' exonuclease PolX [Bacteroidota bacterium]REK05357.1 MAG: DNA polymerase/3'-5' exonuclease PolX [Bacteroidota bacterium]REK32731.1 MAG: DNA polymerase/3'-5' exonuclease PolX [Bacteroidota bacterium]REK49074.1 MAG: DNA polymerase/3'-5' exonuclease PolX [Bacteroidota bacterium]
MSNKEIARAFKLAAQLMELHEENPFKVRSMQNAAFKLERQSVPISNMSPDEISGIEGVGKGIQVKILDLLSKNSFEELEDLRKKTPEGVIEMLGIKGIGPKKVALLWKELGIESTGELLYACNENRLVELKGFGEKTQQQIKHSIEYAAGNEGKYLYAVIEQIALQLEQDLRNEKSLIRFSITGKMRRKFEIIEVLEFVLEIKDTESFVDFLKQHPLVDDELHISPEKISGRIAGKLPLTFYIAGTDNFGSVLFQTTGSDEHISLITNGNGLGNQKYQDEESIYEHYHSVKILPELREGIIEESYFKNKKQEELIEEKDLKGILHNHTTYSDGAHTLEEMASYCRELGYEYLGICDHSKSAFYANGLQPERIILQHKEIDDLNEKMSPFRIIKGIESDILNDGSLDYPDEILDSFDFVVASVHSILRMDIDKATQRLIRAIENPFTTILGHPSGRLLLAREAYPLDYKKVIDACAANGVIIELNANPHRLDLDWRHLPYALEKNVMISINPDAHRKDGYHDMHYGVCVARKGGLTKDMTFNALSLERISEYMK